MIEIVNRGIITALLLLIGTNAWGIDLSNYFGNSYAVVIGISKYQNPGTWKTLDNAENDAQAMDDFLTGQGFKVKRIVGQQATRGNIISYLEDELAPRLKGNDRFVFYFSGHGETKQIGISDFGYIIPYDGDTEKSSTWISMEQLQALADKLDEVRHQLFILDSCLGGLINSQNLKVSGVSSNVPFLEELAGRRVRQYLTAGGANEKTPSTSGLPRYEKYSHYTAYLLRGLQMGVADTQRDGIITTSELQAYLETAAATDYNVPRAGHFPGHEQGDFVFRSPKPAQIVRNSSPVLGPTKGNDKNRYEVERLRAEMERLEQLRAAEKFKPEQRYVRTTHSPRNQPHSQDQAKAQYEWQNDVRYARNSRDVEDFLQRFPTGSHVQDARRKLEQLRKQEGLEERTGNFPWPPPHPSAYSRIPSPLLPNPNNKNYLKNVAQKLEAAFDQAGYSQKRYYQIPDGFALVSQLEQFNSDGTSKTPPDRWATDFRPPEIFSLASYLKALFTANPGRYRIIAFIVTSQPFEESKETVTREEAMAWLDHGMIVLPKSISEQPYTDQHYCTAYIYEFEQPGREKEPLFKPLSNLTGKDHLEKSKLWAALKK